VADFSKLLAKAKGPPMAMPAEDDAEAADPKLDRVRPAAQDLIDAIKSGDVDGAAQALIASHEACGSYSEGSTESEE
jgi:hypothetical protein